MVRTTAVIAILMLFGATVAFPQADSTPAEDNLFQFFFRESFTPEKRVELTRRIDAYCRDVLDKVPANTPAEEAWVTSESKSGGDTDRLNRLVSSKEWARHQLREIFSQCVQAAASLQQAQSQKARSAEAKYFISLAYTFNQDDLGTFAKLVSPRAGVSALALSTFRQLMMIAAMRTLDGNTDPIFQQSAPSR